MAAAQAAPPVFTLIADFGAAIPHRREFVVTCEFEEKSTHSIICCGHTPKVIAVPDNEREQSDDPQRRSFQPTELLSNREAPAVLNPAALGSEENWPVVHVAMCASLPGQQRE